MINTALLNSYIEKFSDSVKVVSFDIFDTILIRLLPSEEVTRMTAEKFSEQLNKETTIVLPPSIYLENRSEFKRQMDKKSLFTDAEWTLSQWIINFSNRYNLDTEIVLRIALQVELEAEFTTLKLAENISESLVKIQKRGLRTIAVSDMWLDQHLLAELLKKFDIIFDAVFSSGTMGASKRRGMIFRKIEKQMGLPSKSFIHVGDNFKADFIRPRLAGWKSLWMPHAGKTFQTRFSVISRGKNNEKNSWKTILNLMQSLNKVHTCDPFFDLGYNCLAPLLIIFSIVQWKNFSKQKIDIAFYIARDTKLILDVYDIIENFLPDSCPRKYVRLSRRSIAIAHPRNLLQNALPLAGKMGTENIGEWLCNFTISSELRRLILFHANLNEEDSFTETARDSIKSACLKLSPEIIKHQNTEINNIRDYLLKKAAGTPLRRVGIVDSGWACTTQDIIREVLNETELISGIYLGVSNQGSPSNYRNLKYGLLRDDFRNCRYHNPVESSAGVVRIWETILREMTGSVIKLQRQPDNNVKALLDPEDMFGEIEYKAADSIKRGVHEGTSSRMKSIALLFSIPGLFRIKDFEIAATEFSKKVSTKPCKDIAKALIHLDFDEGAAGGKKSVLGIKGIQKGVAWYPGILASLGLNWLSPVLEIAARPIVDHKIKSRNK